MGQVGSEGPGALNATLGSPITKTETMGPSPQET